VSPDRGLAGDDCFKFMQKNNGEYRLRLTPQQLTELLEKNSEAVYYL
jgi:hypothetical protein